MLGTAESATSGLPVGQPAAVWAWAVEMKAVAVRSSVSMLDAEACIIVVDPLSSGDDFQRAEKQRPRPCYRGPRPWGVGCTYNANSCPNRCSNKVRQRVRRGVDGRSSSNFKVRARRPSWRKAVAPRGFGCGRRPFIDVHPPERKSWRRAGKRAFPRGPRAPRSARMACAHPR